MPLRCRPADMLNITAEGAVASLCACCLQASRPAVSKELFCIPVIFHVVHATRLLPAALVTAVYLAHCRWLKFLIIWRFFRLASLAAGVDVPENMRRCFANNYDVEAR